MKSVKESSEPIMNGLEDVAQEYWESIQKAIETKANKLKEKAEQDSSQIVAAAKEEAKKIIAQARQDSELESERITTEAKEEARKIAAQARQDAELESERIIFEALKESTRLIGDTKEKLSQVIMEVTEHSITQARDDFAHAASEAKNELEDETSKILTRVSKSVKKIIGKTNKADGQIGDRDDDKLFQGRIKVEIAYPSYKDAEEQSSIENRLTQIPGLKFISTDSYAQGNNLIMAYIIELEEPLNLLEAIKATIQVKDVAEQEGNILIMAK